MDSSMRTTRTIEMKEGVCCFKFAEMLVGLNMGIHVPMAEILSNLEAAKRAGASGEMGFFVAVAVGHRIREHRDTLEAAVKFAGWSGVPDSQVVAHRATAADLVDDCDMNREVGMSIIEHKGSLPADMAAEIYAMAKVAKLPGDFSDAQIIVALHYMKTHEWTLEKAIELCVGDSTFAKAVRERRLN